MREFDKKSITRAVIGAFGVTNTNPRLIIETPFAAAATDQRDRFA